MKKEDDLSQEAYKNMAKLLDFIDKDNKKHGGNDIYIYDVNVSEMLKIGIKNIESELKKFYENIGLGDVKAKTLEAIKAFNEISKDSNEFIKSLKNFPEVPTSMKTVSETYNNGELFTVNESTKKLFDTIKGLHNAISKKDIGHKVLGE